LDAFAAIDWGGAHHQLAVVDGGGREVRNERFAPDGLDDLLAALGEHGVASVALERSEGLLNRWKPALNAFAITFEGRLFTTTH